MGPPAASPYSVEVSGPMKNHRNGIVEKSVLLTHIPNLRYQRRRGVPRARPSRPPDFIRFQEPALRVSSLSC